MRRMLLLAAVMGLAYPLGAQDVDPDRNKNSRALFTDGFRLETEKPVDRQAAIEKYAKAVAMAESEEPNAKDDEAKKAIRATAAEALVRTGYCNEKMEPANVAGAQAAFAQVVSKYSDVERWGTIAKEKVALKGVDVYLRLLHAGLREWRDSPARSTLDIAAKKTETRGKIEPLGQDSVYGLVWGLGHEDEIIRDFSANLLTDIADATGIATVIEKLNDANPVVRAGASTTLKKIFKRYNDAADLERSADNLLRDTAIPLEGTTTERTQGSINKLREQASTLKAKAKEIRSNIPDSLDVDQIRGALVKIISDEKANVQARVEAAQAAASIGLIKGEVAGAIVTGMQSPNRNVRQACARAAGAVDPTSSDDRQKITALLMAIVKYEPEKPHSEKNVPPGGAADAPPAWGNDPLVRQAAAESLENIALIKSLPALIEALDDNSVSVRQAAHRALQVITRLDFGYEPDAQPLSRDQTLEAIVTQRREGQQKWQEWWDKTKGIAVLVERFWYFQSEWKEFNAVRLFEPEVFLGEVKSRQWASRDPKADLERAERVVKKFQGFKDIFAAEAIALGPEAIDLLLEFIGGETKKQPEGNAPTRWFVAEACARIINQHGVAEKVAAIRDKVNSGSDAKKIGASIALGFLDKDKTGASEREVLVRGLASQDNLLRTACANSLRKIGEAEANAPDLTRAATDANADDKVRLEALRAIAQLKPKQKATIDAIGEMVYDEPTIEENRPSKMAKNAYVREMVVIALGAIADPAATKYLIRARRDTAKVVRLAATQAITSVYAAGKDTFKEEALKILKDERNKTLDRIGAAWTIGDTGDSAFARHLTFRLKDENPPLILKDRDSEVRKSVCEALALMGDKARDRTVVGTLIGVMGDENEREGPRDAAYSALKSVTGQDVAKFNSTDIEQMRKEAVKKWQDWFKTADLPEEL